MAETNHKLQIASRPKILEEALSYVQLWMKIFKYKWLLKQSDAVCLCPSRSSSQPTRALQCGSDLRVVSGGEFQEWGRYKGHLFPLPQAFLVVLHSYTGLIEPNLGNLKL